MNNSCEYTNSYTSPNNEYGSLANSSSYNTLFAEPLPQTVPSMVYPVIMEQSNPYGYDVLTHDSDGTGYYTLLSAYGKSCNPSYYVAKCPTNKFIRPFVPKIHDIVHPTACPVNNASVAEGYQAPPSSALEKELAHLKIIFFYDKKCPYSIKTNEEFIKALGAVKFREIVTHKDISVGSNEQELTNLGGFAVPYLYSVTTGNSVTGYVSIPKYIEELKKTPVKQVAKKMVNNLHQKIKDLGIVVYTMGTCVYCKKLLAMLEPYKDVIEVRDGLDKRFANLLKNVRGFPHTVSKTKSYTGCPPSVEVLIEKLS
jgi:glutaredoxin